MSSQQASERPRSPATRITPFHFGRGKQRGDLIAMVTAYDAPSARLAEAAGVDGILVGDSAAMTVLGHDSTVQITVDEMLVLTRAVSRSVRRPLVVADMPFGSFQVSDEEAVRHAVRLVKEGGAGAVKLEGAGPTLSRVSAIVRVAMPAIVAARITELLVVPTIGIGAGPRCDGQILVWHDLLGMTPGHVPQFVKRYAELGQTAKGALESYVADVRTGKFPETQHSYQMAEGEEEEFALRNQAIDHPV
jgi:3-methyl-2-oxobutanoate hydroxymethyltransferase